jgi:hypothetical protein
MQMFLKIGYSYAGGTEYEYSVTESQSGVSLVDQKQGIQGIGVMPANGDTVIIFTDTIADLDYIKFKPGLNNTVYYLITTQPVVDRDAIIANGTPVAMAVVGGRYEGSFVFSNPFNFQYLHLAVDYTNSVGVTSFYTYPANAEEVLDFEMSSAVGRVNLEYVIAAGAFRLAVEYNDLIVENTGVVLGPLTANLTFVKTSPTANTGRVIVINEGAANTLRVNAPVISLTSFYIDQAAGTLSNVCSQMATTQMYHNGAGTLPVAGDIIYLDSAGADVYDGENSYHVFSTVIMGAPSASSVYGAVLSTGVVSATGTCVCSEVAIPVITQSDIYITQNQDFSLYVEVSNNPNSWELVTTCNEYSLDGGSRGAVFNYTDCNAASKNATSGVNQILNVCASTLPTVTAGTGTVTLIGTCMEGSLPKGINFKDGIIFGRPVTTGRTTIELIATNCFGDSANTTFDIIAQSAIDMKPFAIDIDEPADSGAGACGLTGALGLRYHNGRNTNPILNDVVFEDIKGVDRFVGGNMWFMIDDIYSIQIDSVGTVIDTHTC